LQDKREFYRRPEVVDSYERQRFGGPSGTRVNAREIEIVLSMVPNEGRVLDLACGTGRVIRALVDRGQSVVGLDSSPSMAAQATSAGAAALVGDGLSSPFRPASFDSVVSLRFAFHCPELEPLLREMRRIVVPGGSLVFDTYSWSPRAAWALGARRWGGHVYLHSRREVAALTAQVGLKVERADCCFLFSPYLYRLVPLPLERAFEALENHVPRSWLCRVFWKLRA
jgi:SAM-dependent methyltransferase